MNGSESELNDSSSGSRGNVNLIVALACEARPLIRYFKLRQQENNAGLREYSDGAGITLLVSGVGKIATACACGYLAGRQSHRRKGTAAWLNVGIAGHGTRPVGQGVLINKVTDRVSERTSYPPLLLNSDFLTSGLVTVDHPETEYPDDCAYDMEGSVFVATAGRFSTAELVQLYKIVSDNPTESVSAVNEKRITAWVESNLEELGRLVASLGELSEEINQIYALPDEYYELESQARLSVSQRVQLATAFRRYYALGGTGLRASLGTWKTVSGAELLRRIRKLTPSL